MGNLMMRWNRKASGSRLLETETPEKLQMPAGDAPQQVGQPMAMDGRRNAATFAVFTACESAAIREPASAGRPLAAAGGGTMGTSF